jgi:GNAT superfamily N-acetyltransferase
MSLTWSREDRPTWDDTKQRIIGGAPEGALELDFTPGQDLPGDWFVASDGGKAVGYGWLDSTWGGDTEILLAVDPQRQQGGVGSFVLANIEREAARRGTNYVYNTVRDTHPDRDAVHDWLLVRGYEGNENDASLRKRVTGAEEAAAPAPARATAASGSSGAAPEGRPPGHEESGGYVNVEDHRY